MKFYLKHILTREVTNAHDCLVIIFRKGTLRETVFIFIKEKK